MVRRMREMLAFLWVVMVVMVVGCEKADLAKHCHLSGCNAGIANDRCCLEIYQCKSACGQSTMCSELNKIDLREFAENRVKPLNKIYRREFAVKCKTPPGYDAITVPCPPPDQKRTSGQQGASKGQTTAKPSQNSAPTGQQGASKGQTTAKPSQNSAPTRQRGTSKVRSTEESSRNSARRNQVALLIPPNSVSFTAAAHSGDDEIGGHIFDFLFAAQDVSTSSLPWAVTLLDSHPDVLAKIREEQDRIRLPGSDARAGFITPEQLREMKYTEMEDKEVVRFRPPGSDARAGFITPEQLREMKYTEMVAKEVVRFRPPAPLVPHIAGEEFPIADKYTVPKGAIVFPSVLESSFEGFTEADRFDPERFNESRQEDLVFKRSFLALGAGPHRCVG